MFALIPTAQRLKVEGHSDASGVGDFDGLVLAIALRGGDPVAAPSPEEAVVAGGEPEGLLGWGETYFLVSDTEKPAPVWVSKADVESHQVLDPLPEEAG